MNYLNLKDGRQILLCDANSFYASVEQAQNPELRGKPVVIVGDPERRSGIVLAASREAKAYVCFATRKCRETRRKSAYFARDFLAK